MMTIDSKTVYAQRPKANLLIQLADCSYNKTACLHLITKIAYFALQELKAQNSITKIAHSALLELKAQNSISMSNNIT